MSSASDVRELRGEILKLNADLRVMTNLAQAGNLTLRDMLVLTRLFTGGSPELTRLITELQLAIALIQTARTTLKLLQIEMGPLGWILLTAGIVAGVTIGTEMELRRPSY